MVFVHTFFDLIGKKTALESSVHFSRYWSDTGAFSVQQYIPLLRSLGEKLWKENDQRKIHVSPDFTLIILWTCGECGLLRQNVVHLGAQKSQIVFSTPWLSCTCFAAKTFTDLEIIRGRTLEVDLTNEIPNAAC